ncbi:MAG: ABC transporter permease subunit [Erysipelotrichaceae bacterium]|nr:ABC transporter permease subunit [Erysipelotrichaceae bacterium]
MKSMVRKWISTVVIFIIWWGLSLVIRNEVLLPNPWDVLARMAEMVQSAKFYSTCGITLWRMLKGLCIAGVLGILLGYTTTQCTWFGDVFYPIEMMMKTIPNISYIIIALIWIGSQNSVIVVGFFVIFPIFFANTQKAMLSLDKGYDEVASIYGVSTWTRFSEIHIPLIRSSLYAALQTSIGLGLKVCVMAEILGRVQQGIGFQIDFCRLNLDMTGVFAWTVWIILFSVGVDTIFGLFTQKK